MVDKNLFDTELDPEIVKVRDQIINKIGDIKEEMTPEDSLRNWEHEDAKGYAEKLIDEYGQPDEVTETMLKWNKLGSFGEGEK